MARRQGRPKGGEQALTRERILATALRLVDAHGVEALSMRRLASELGVDAMAIYHHLPGKQALLAGLVANVFDELAVPTLDGGTWQDRVRAFAHAYHDLARAHPRLVLYLTTDLTPGADAVLAANEALYAALADAGLPSRVIAHAADLLVDYLNGFALGVSPPDETSTGQDLQLQLGQHPSDRFPTLRRVMDELVAEEPVVGIAAGLEIILAGLTAMSKDEQASSSE